MSVLLEHALVLRSLKVSRDFCFAGLLCETAEGWRLAQPDAVGCRNTGQGGRASTRSAGISGSQLTLAICALAVTLGGRRLQGRHDVSRRCELEVTAGEMCKLKCLIHTDYPSKPPKCTLLVFSWSL